MIIQSSPAVMASNSARRNRLAAGCAFEEHRMAKEIEFDAVDVIVPTDFLNVTKRQVADFGKREVHC